MLQGGHVVNGHNLSPYRQRAGVGRTEEERMAQLLGKDELFPEVALSAAQGSPRCERLRPQP